MALFKTGIKLLTTMSLLVMCVGAAFADNHSNVDQGSASCVIVQHFYFSKPGKETEVIATRIKGNEVRAALGLPISWLLVLESSFSGHPSKGVPMPGNASYLMSETVFKNEAEMAHSKAALSASENYISVRKQMGVLIDHFEAAVRRPVGGKCS